MFAELSFNSTDEFVFRPEARWETEQKQSIRTQKKLKIDLYRIGESEIHMLGWNVPPEELSTIPEHWLSYPEPNASLHYLLGTLYIAFTFFSLIGNGLVLWIFSSAKSLRTPSNVFVINLAFCDFIMMTKTPIFIYNSFNRGYALGHLGCQVFALMGALSGIGAAITNAAIAYDRWVYCLEAFVFSSMNSNPEICVCVCVPQLSCDCKSIGTKDDNAKSDFYGYWHLVLRHSVVSVSIFTNLGTFCSR